MSYPGNLLEPDVHSNEMTNSARQTTQIVGPQLDKCGPPAMGRSVKKSEPLFRTDQVVLFLSCPTAGQAEVSACGENGQRTCHRQTL
jgi:hypothetical protein